MELVQANSESAETVIVHPSAERFEVSDDTKHTRNMHASALLLRRLQTFHYSHAPAAYKARFVPVAPTPTLVAGYKPPEPIAEAPTPIADQMAQAWEILEPRKVTVAEIQRLVCKQFDLNMADMKSTRRHLRLVRPRQIAMYLCCQFTTRSLPEIGRHFGRDHTTVIHAQRKINQLIVLNDQIRAHVETLSGILNQREVVERDNSTNRETCASPLAVVPQST